MPTPPTLKFHKAAGQWYIRYNRTFFYLGTKKSEAENRMPDELTRWARWVASRKTPARSSHERTVSHVATEFLESVGVDVNERAMIYYRGRLIRFLAAWGRVPLARIRPPEVNPLAWLNAMKADMTMAKLRPSTINHDLGAAKRLLQFAMDMHYIPPFNLRSVRKVSQGARPRKDRSLPEVVRFIRTIESADERLYPWARIMYLTACRPIELFRLMRGEGSWEYRSPGGSVYRTLNKSAKRTGDDRYVVLTPHATDLLLLGWFLRGQHEDAGTAWLSQSGFQQAVGATGVRGGVHFLRHSAASHLRQMGCSVEETQIALGHWPSGAWRNYVTEAWQRPLAVMSKLTLPPPGTAEESARCSSP